MRIRRYTTDDCIRVSKFLTDVSYKSLYGKVSQTVLDRELQCTIPEVIYWRALYEHVFLLEENVNELVGVGSTRESLIESGNVDIGLLFIRSDLQGRGIGKNFFKALLRSLSEYEYDGIYVPALLTAKGFYERFGFKESKRIHSDEQDYIILYKKK